MEEVSQAPGWLPVARMGMQILIPVVFVLSSVRLLLTEAFVQLEYNLPGFPADPFGFSKQDRLRWAPIALDYLMTDAGIDFLGDLKFDDGAPVYNARELRHMEDVKAVTSAALLVWKIGAAAALALGILVWRVGGLEALQKSLMAGSRASLILMGALLLGLLLAFSLLFVGFHRVFFQDGTWVFSYRDTLIRLFPERFWQVAFGAVGIGTAAQAGALYLLARFALRR